VIRPFIAFVFALVLTAMQSALLHFIGGGAAPLALALPIVVYLGLRAGNVDGALGAAAVGYVLDVTSGCPKGLMMFLSEGLFLVSRMAGAALSVQGKSGFAVLSGIGTFLFGLGALVLTRAVAPAESAPGFGLLGRVLLEATFTGLLSPFVMVAMRKLDGLSVREEPGGMLLR
jgi:rod shape-determining protein MreD